MHMIIGDCQLFFLQQRVSKPESITKKQKKGKHWMKTIEKHHGGRQKDSTPNGIAISRRKTIRGSNRGQVKLVC